MEFFDHLDPLLRTFWYIALPTSLVFLIQVIATFVGADASDGINADFNGDFDGTDAPFQLFSLRNLVNFLLGFGWSGVSFYSSIPNKTILIFVALGIGLLFVGVFFFIIRQVQKLEEDNSFRLENTIDKTADVYLTIPGEKQGKGKILVSVKGAVHELEAMTEGKTIPSGSVVKVLRIENNNLLIVQLV